MEVWPRIETLESGAVRLHFEGRLRQKDRFGRMNQHPVSFVTEYTLDGSETLSVRSKTSVSSLDGISSAFLSWMYSSTTLDGFVFQNGSGELLAKGKPLETQGRSFQTLSDAYSGAFSAEFPASLDLTSEGSPLLTVSDFSGDTPWNVFLDRSNFFISFYDGNLTGKDGQKASATRNYEWKFRVH